MANYMADFNWDEGLTMPVANAENKRLEEEIQVKEKQIAELQGELNRHDDVVHAMSNHLKNVRQELSHTQQLLLAKQREVDTEEHLEKVSLREEGRLKQDLQRLQLLKDQLDERKGIYQNVIFKHQQLIEEVKSRMKWDQTELEKWIEASAKKDEDFMAIQKYAKQDQSKIKELSLQLEKLTHELQQRKKKLDEEVMNTQISQIELEKTAEEFRKAHDQRQELIAQWEHTIEMMQRRDREMDQLANQLAKLKGETFDKEMLVRDKQTFLEKEQANVREHEKNIGVAERNAAKLKDELQRADLQRVQFGDELEALRRTVDRTAIDLEASRAEVNSLKKDVVDKQGKLAQVKTVREKLIQRLKTETDTMLTSEERVQRFEQLLKQEEARQKQLEFELKALREMQYKKADALYQLKQNQKTVEAEIQGTRAALKNLNTQLVRLDNDALKQQEILYTQDFTIQQLERRISRMQGEQSNEEKVHLERRIEELTKELEGKQQIRTLLQNRLKQLAEDIRKRKRELEKSNLEKVDLLSKINEINLHIGSSEKEMRTLISTKQDEMVNENILRLEVNKLRQALYQKSDEVMTLEKRRLQLETAMKERMHEIGLYKQRQQAEVRAIESERQQLSAELHERLSKIDKLRKRFEILMVSMAPPEGEEERSQAYYVIRAAQEKEELQCLGDELDAKIRKAEKEIQALENTLRVLNSRNDTYRKNFMKIGETSEEASEKRQLEDQIHAVMEKLRYKKRLLKDVQDDIAVMQNTMDNLGRDEAAYSSLLQEKENQCTLLRKEIDDLEAKYQRALKMSQKLSRDIRAKAKAQDETDGERDVRVREQREFNQDIVRRLKQLADESTDVRNILVDYLEQANVPMDEMSIPSTPASVSSVRSLSSSVSGSARSFASLSDRRVTQTQIDSPHGSTAGSSSSSAVRMGRADIGADFQSPSQSQSRSPKVASLPGSGSGSRKSSNASSRQGSETRAPASRGSQVGSASPASSAASAASSARGSRY